MKNTQIESLLPLSRTEPGQPPTRSLDDATAFDRLFRQANSLTPAPTSQPPAETVRSNPLRPSSFNDASPFLSASTVASQSLKTASSRTIFDSGVQVADDNRNSRPADDEPDTTDTSATTDESSAFAVSGNGAVEPPFAEQHHLSAESGNSPTEIKLRQVEPAANIAAPLPAVDVDQLDSNSANDSGEAGEPASRTLGTPTDPLSSQAEVSSSVAEHVDAGAHPLTSPALADSAIELRSQLSQSNTATAEHATILTTSATESDGQTDGSKEKDSKTGRASTVRERVAAIARTAGIESAVAVAADVERPAAPIAAATLSAAIASGDPTAGSNSSNELSDKKVAGSERLISPLARFDRTAVNNSPGSQGTDKGEGVSHIDPSRFVNRVARAIHSAHERGGPLQLRLAPPELGAIRLELSLQHGALTATIETENLASRQVLLDNLPALRDRLAEQNIRIDRFDVDVRRDGDAQQFTAPRDRNEHGGHRPSPHHRGPARNSADTSATEVAPVSPRSVITNISINVIA